MASARNGFLDPHLRQSSPWILQHMSLGAVDALYVASQSAGTPSREMRGRDALLFDTLPEDFLEVFARREVAFCAAFHRVHLATLTRHG